LCHQWRDPESRDKMLDLGMLRSPGKNPRLRSR
jgi:hypothetical protein